MKHVIDSKLFKLILESKVRYSKEFIKALHKIEHPLAKKILEMHDKDIDIMFNFIDISDELDMVKFIPDKKANEILDKNPQLYRVDDKRNLKFDSEANYVIFDTLTLDRDKWYSADINDIGIILSEMVSKKGNTYVLFQCKESEEGDNVGKQCVVNKEGLEPFNELESKVWIEVKNKIKIGKIVRNFLTKYDVKFTDRDIEDFVNQYKSYIKILNDVFIKFAIVSGKDIAFWYKGINYAGNSSSVLKNSCMASMPENIFDIYTKNKNVSMVILFDDNGEIEDGKYVSTKISGRALLWKMKDGDTFMDRVYYVNDSDQELFAKWADMNNIWRKKYNEASEEFDILRKDECKEASIVVELENVGYDYPYVDSLCFFYKTAGGCILSNMDDYNGRPDYVLRDTSGDREPFNNDDDW